MKKNWIVLANAARARILERDEHSGQLQELTDVAHPPSREKGMDLNSDRPGHAQKAHGDPGHAGTAFQARTDPREKEHAIFALELSRYLEEAIIAGRCTGLALIASLPFLGELRKHLGEGARRIVSADVPHDLTSFSGQDLEQRVTKALETARR
jgi:protein required for attachment to host cells